MNVPENERQRENERGIRKEREKVRERGLSTIKIISVLVCSFLIFLFNLLYLSHSLERGKLLNENRYKYLAYQDILRLLYLDIAYQGILKELKNVKSFTVFFFILLYLSHFALEINGLVSI